ncbi:hypothetical protein Hneap_1287 [Halothiobacillus neapolitanus c2]|uniref:Uncharacterized protein n=1 Tax=Halothiobacillus neapolitanus (strain ATCC 23641 / DSM 15147 / CIP 104769 / NCIMB 8539 / c2) TaxID=555778 RepID=D0L0A0_HALNC|nr:hypothetical protein Hneap_1287 [Halothiobacillus neapolitanus c2]TDN66430.1 hypothetical protein C8D83_101763 [Halothiobacillus neapolitanus]
MRHDGVAVLAKGVAIACARRLVLTHSDGSESTSKSKTVHWLRSTLKDTAKDYLLLRIFFISGLSKLMSNRQAAPLDDCCIDGID